MLTIQAHRQEQHAKANQLGAEEYNEYDDEDVKLHFTNDGVKFFAEIVLPLIQSYFKAHQHYYVTLLYALSVFFFCHLACVLSQVVFYVVSFMIRRV